MPVPNSVSGRLNANRFDVLLGSGCANARNWFDVGNFVIRVNDGDGVGIGLGLGPGNGVAFANGNR